MAICLLYSLKIPLTLLKVWESWEVTYLFKWKRHGSICVIKPREYKRIKRYCELIRKTKKTTIVGA
jgi:hypothetical protein